MRVYIDWQQQGASSFDLDDDILRQAAEEGVNLDDEDAVAHFVAKRLVSNPRWFHDLTDEADEKDAPTLINPPDVMGDPPQWWIDAHPEVADD